MSKEKLQFHSCTRMLFLALLVRRVTRKDYLASKELAYYYFLFLGVAVALAFQEKEELRGK